MPPVAHVDAKQACEWVDWPYFLHRRRHGCAMRRERSTATTASRSSSTSTQPRDRSAGHSMLSIRCPSLPRWSERLKVLWCASRRNGCVSDRRSHAISDRLAVDNEPPPKWTRDRGICSPAHSSASRCWWGAVVARPSRTRSTYDFDIAALAAVASAAGFLQANADCSTSTFRPTTKKKRLVVRAVKGHYTADEALASPLPAGFTFSWVNERTVAVLSPPENVPPGGVNTAVAAKDQQRSELSKEQQLSMANGGGRSGSARGPYEFEGKMLVEASRQHFRWPRSRHSHDSDRSQGHRRLGACRRSLSSWVTSRSRRT